MEVSVVMNFYIINLMFDLLNLGGINLQRQTLYEQKIRFAAKAAKVIQKKIICSNNCQCLCKKCSTVNCYRTYSDYSIKKCSKLLRYPYVCNGSSTPL